MEKLTGIDHIILDTHFEGGGTHEIKAGGFLKVHTDFNWHKTLRLDRSINLLIYLNEEWDESWGGELELWDSEMKGKVVSTAPIFNRTVVFSTTGYSYHGHPDPIACPEGVSRQSIATYYYSNERPKE